MFENLRSQLGQLLGEQVPGYLGALAILVVG